MTALYLFQKPLTPQITESHISKKTNGLVLLLNIALVSKQINIGTMFLKLIQNTFS